VVKAWILGIAVAVAAAAPASAQQPPRTDQETIRARQNISIIEGSFERAVQNAAANFSRQVQAVAPNSDGMAMLLGAPQVRGFRLEPNGVIFFDVEMPSLQLSMVWPLRYSQTSQATTATLSDLHELIQRSMTDPLDRQRAQNLLRLAQSQMTPARRPGTVSQVTTLGQPAAPVPEPSPADTGILDDPREAWRREVLSTLTDAMLQHTSAIAIGPNDYMVVAARGALAGDRLVADSGDMRTMELRLKGSDLLAYQARTITLEEARKCVEVREY
jgi:hypothetical protein